MVDHRVTLRTRSRTYNTRSNAVRTVRTPGNRLVTQKLPKVTNQPRCRISGKVLNGISGGASRKLHGMKKSQRTVSRPYGGNLAGSVVRERIIRAFLREETRLAAQAAKQKSTAAK